MDPFAVLQLNMCCVGASPSATARDLQRVHPTQRGGRFQDEGQSVRAHASTPFSTGSRAHAVRMSTFYTTGDGLAFPNLGGIQATVIDVEPLGERAIAVKVVASNQRCA